MGIVNKVKDTLWGAPDKGISGEPDPGELSVDNAYKTSLGIELLIVILIQLAILVVLAVKL